MNYENLKTMKMGMGGALKSIITFQGLMITAIRSLNALNRQTIWQCPQCSRKKAQPQMEQMQISRISR